jgi:hypothetical protein
MFATWWSADAAGVLLLATGGGVALACAYLAQQRAPRTTRAWVAAILVAIPGLLFGWALAQPQLGIRSAYKAAADVFPQTIVGGAEVATISEPSGQEATSSGDAGETVGSAGLEVDVVSREPAEALGGRPQTAEASLAPSPSPSPTSEPSPSPTSSPSVTPSTDPSPAPSEIPAPPSPTVTTPPPTEAPPPPAPESSP